MSFSKLSCLSSDPSSITSSASSSASFSRKSFRYDVFLSFRGEDTRNSFVDHLYEALKNKSIYTYKDDERIQKGERINEQLIKSIQESRFYIIVFSKNYAYSSWCLDELVKIMECHKMDEHTAYPVFIDVEPTEVRNQSGAVGEAFAKHEKEEDAGKWREALQEAANLAGWVLKNTVDRREAKFIQRIVHEISLELRLIPLGYDENLVGMKSRVRDVVPYLKMGTDEVLMIGIKGIVGGGKTALAGAVVDNLSNDFEAVSFVENVREASKRPLGLEQLIGQVLSDVLKEDVTVTGVHVGKTMMGNTMNRKTVLLVLDDVDHSKQLEALAGEPKWFKPGSRIIITTRDEQVLVAHRVKVILDITLLSEHEAICLLSRCLFGQENPLHGYEELSRKVVRYAAGLPSIVKALGAHLCGKDKDELAEAIDRLKRFPLNETLERLKLSYTSLEDDQKEIFLDIGCILKGQTVEDAIRILDCCGFHARIGLKVLQQRSLITISEDGVLGMHDRLEELGKFIVCSLHPDEPNKQSHMWNDEEIEDILANDVGTEATRCLKLNTSRVNLRIVMKGVGKMKKLRYLDVNLVPDFDYESDDACLASDSKLDDATQYFTNSLRYLKCTNYPFLYLPKTFQANNLVGLQIDSSRMVQLWEEGEIKVLRKLKFLSLFKSKLTTFDFRMTPNLETLILRNSDKLVELCMPVSCQKLKRLEISDSKLKTFDLGLTPNLETLSLDNCTDFEELHVSVACPNLKFLSLCKSRLRSLDLEMIPNIQRIYHTGCDELEINGCLEKSFT